MQNSKSHWQRGKRFVILLPLILGACGSQTLFKGKIKATPAHLSFCDGAEPMHWNSKNSNWQIQEVKEHNQVGVDLHCPKWAIAPPQ